MPSSRSLKTQILRFLVTGGLAFIIDYGLLIACTELLGLNYLVSATIGFSVSVIFNYIISVIWVFVPAPGKSRLATMTLFISLSVIGLLINNGIMWAMVELFGLWYAFAKIVATAVVMVFNFITRKILIEHRSTVARSALPSKEI